MSRSRGAKILEKMLRQLRHVFFALSERWDGKCHGVDAVEQVLAEAALCDERLKILIGGSHDANVRVKRARAPNRSILTPIQESAVD